MTLGLNWEGAKQKYTYQKMTYQSELKDRAMSLEFIDLNSPLVVAVNCDNRKAMGKEKWHRTRLEKSTKNDNIEFRKKAMTQWKSKFEINKELEFK